MKKRKTKIKMKSRKKKQKERKTKVNKEEKKKKYHDLLLFRANLALAFWVSLLPPTGYIFI